MDVRERVMAEVEYQWSGRTGTELRSPLYEALGRAMADDDDLLALVAGGRQQNPRLLLAAVHYLLLGGVEHPLCAWYPTLGGERSVGDGSALATAFRDFCEAHRVRIEELLAARVVQTNEVRRCAFLYPAVAVAAGLTEQPVALVELGTSAGLNLLVDRFGYRYGSALRAGHEDSPVQIDCELRGERTPPLPATLPIVHRLGVDHDPVNVADEDRVRWLRACVWGDHVGRFGLLERAIEVARVDPPPIIDGDMVDRLGDALALVPDDVTPLVFHTTTLVYLPAIRRQAFVDAIARAGVSRQLLWLSGEAPWLLPGLPAVTEAEEAMAMPLRLVEVDDREMRHHLLGLTGPQAGWLDWRHVAPLDLVL